MFNITGIMILMGLSEHIYFILDSSKAIRRLDYEKKVFEIIICCLHYNSWMIDSGFLGLLHFYPQCFKDSSTLTLAGIHGEGDFPKKWKYMWPDLFIDRNALDWGSSVANFISFLFTSQSSQPLTSYNFWPLTISYDLLIATWLRYAHLDGNDL